MRNGYAALALVACLGGMIVAGPAKADLQEEMNLFFDGLANVTDPTLTSTARRGVIAGGSVQVRNPIIDTNLVTFTPPSFQAGCGGVDLFGGSFSYVSGDQIVPLLKAIAANAVGYAFQIGLSAICETCMGAIETMQKKVQALNQHFGNSCQLAQGVVNDTLSAAGYQRHTEASIINTVTGAAEDIFEAQSGDALGDAQATAPDQVAEQITGNLVWRALIQQDAVGRFAFGDIELLEVMMNLTGTIIVGTPVDDGDGTTAPVRLIPANYQLFDVMLDGGDAAILGCNGEEGANECLEPAARTITLEGFEDRSRRLLLGDDVSPGIVAKLQDQGQASELTDEENQLLLGLPHGVGGLLVRVGSISVPAARTFVEQLLPHLAIDWARTLSRDLIETVASAVTLIDSEHAPAMNDQVAKARDRLDEDVRHQQDTHGPLSDLIRVDADILDATESTIFAASLTATERP
ncbi:MAG: conjugal transfer protein TraH [Alphaproteobacteria bacterium]|nr:conjugal transfer protein TraH [Alphaproteobacteria bacterium]